MVELAQNAADAAARAGVPGRLLLRLADGVLIAANTGARLDSAGAEALSTLRASSKRDASTVGRFGVGFAAVLAVSDSPAIGSRPPDSARSDSVPAVVWDRAKASSDVASRAKSFPGLAAELAARGTHVPVLRLPYPGEVRVPEGYDTAVVLPLRDAAASAAVSAQLEALGDWLLLALPDLAEVRVEVPSRAPLVLAGAADRWLVVRRVVELPSDLLQERPLEERTRTLRALTWALPQTALAVRDNEAPDPPGVVLAPTPTDEPLALPAMLIADLPLDPDRRHVAPGRVLDAMVSAAGEAYVALLREVALIAPAAVLGLLPGPVGAGPVDGAVRAAAYAVLPTAPLLPTAAGRRLVAPRDAVLLDGAPPEALVALAPLVGRQLLAAECLRRGALLESLGAARVALADLVAEWRPPSLPAGEWRALYDALAAADRESLGVLPVPLADGRVVRGARGCVLLSDGASGTTTQAGTAVLHALQVLGVRIVDPGAAHPLLERLGAARAAPAALLRLPEVGTALLRQADASDDEADEVAEAVLTLVCAAGPDAGGDVPGLSRLLLRSAHGDLLPAADLLLPGSPLAALADPEVAEPVAPDLVARWGPDLLGAVGVAGSLAPEAVHDLVVDLDVPADDSVLDLHDLAGWLEEVLELCGHPELPPTVPEALVVPDLDLIADQQWGKALRLLASGPPRAAVVRPTRVILANGAVREVPSYAASWLRHHARLRGQRLTAYALAGDPLLAGLYPRLPIDLDLDFARAVGVRVDLTVATATREDLEDLLRRVGDRRRRLPSAQLMRLYAALASAPPRHIEPPEFIRVPDGTGTRVVPNDIAGILDAPYLLPFLAHISLIPLPPERAARLADLLDLGLASEEVRLTRPEGGVRTAMPPAVLALVPGAPSTYWHYDELFVDDVSLPWAVIEGEVHARTTLGLAYAACWAAGAWPLRDTVAAVLAGRLPFDEAVLMAAF